MTWSDTHLRDVAVRRSRIPYLLMLAVLLWAVFPFIAQHSIENRPLRDALGLTPFDSVVVTERELRTPDTLALMGTAIKRRCEFVGMSANVLDLTGYADRAEVEMRPADVTNKPESDMPQLWGPHLIHRPRTVSVPVAWELWVTHLCPSVLPGQVGTMEVQTNLFATGPWSSM